MPHLSIPFIFSIVGATAVLLWRLRETTRPVSEKSIIIPPLGMSTGMAMFFFPPTRVPMTWALIALSLGAFILAYPLIHTSTLFVQDDRIFLRRSKAFLWVLLALFCLRTGLRGYVEQHVSLIQTGSIFYLLAFGMIVHWRVNMWFRFKRLKAGL